MLEYHECMGKKETATLGGGCFWCLEAFYKLVNGINKVTSGYSGGHIKNPTTAQIYSGKTGHAEVVQLEFNPDKISYEEILKIFFVMHDPTTLNRQGNDVGKHYRSVIFYHHDRQKIIAEDLKNGFASDLWKDPIVTQIDKFEEFWAASEEQQNFYQKNPYQPYCVVVIEPKVQKLRQEFAKYLVTS